ncbi:CRAL-TRIO domain-containing protein C589.09, mitochondrial-like [Dendronephthya gigantea]|uniref:CRAL-TRIO domain-containing protein C589.09, mitochondrial-like n=1 Tax=Dendronephthya gigantea TaxID=151771 RepID=UPI00106D9CC4|nr:CRAL-TRIO domain-containing protein C589.09, mitochondrial-like [Dendronephthya gigantea]
MMATSDGSDVFSVSPATYKEEDFIELKERMQLLFNADPSQLQTDACLKRFLKAFLTVEDAFEGLVKYVKWRKEYGVETLNSTHPDIQSELSTGKVLLPGFMDKAGRPTVLAYARLHDASTRDLDQLTRFTVYIIETATAKCDESVIDNICFLFDLKEFSLNNMDYGFVKQLIWLLSRRYPERLGKCLILNAPFIFSGCWLVIKLWLNEVTRSKIIFIRDKNHLEEYIDQEYIPSSLFS